MSYEFEDDSEDRYGSLRRCSPDESLRGPVLNNTKTVHFPEPGDEPASDSVPERSAQGGGRVRSRPQNSEQKTLDMQNDFRDLFDSTAADDDPWVTLVSTNESPFSPKPPSSAHKSSRGGSSAGARPKVETAMNFENRDRMLERLVQMRDIYSPLPKSEHEDPTLSPNPWIRELSTRYGRKIANISVEKEQLKTEKALAERRPASRSRSPGSRGGTPATWTQEVEWERVTSAPSRPLSVGSGGRPRPELRTGNNVGAGDSVVARVDSGEVADRNTALLFMDNAVCVAERPSPYFAGASFLDAIPALPDHVQTGTKRPASRSSGVGGSRPGSSVYASHSRPLSQPSPPQRPKSTSSETRRPNSKSAPRTPGSASRIKQKAKVAEVGKIKSSSKSSPGSARSPRVPPPAESASAPGTPGHGARRLRPPYSATTISISDFYDEITNPSAPSSRAPRTRTESEAVTESEVAAMCIVRRGASILVKPTAPRLTERERRKRAAINALRALIWLGAFSSKVADQGQWKRRIPSDLAGTASLLSNRVKRNAAPNYGSYGATVAPPPDAAALAAAEFAASPFNTAHAAKIGVPGAIAAGKLLKKANRGVTFIAEFDVNQPISDDVDGDKMTLVEVVAMKHKEARQQQKNAALFVKLLESREQQERRESQQRHETISAQQQEEMELARAYALIAAGGGRKSMMEKKYTGLVQRHDFNKALAEGIEHVHAPPTEHAPMSSPSEIFHHEILVTETDLMHKGEEQQTGEIGREGKGDVIGALASSGAGANHQQEQPPTDWDDEEELQDAQGVPSVVSVARQEGFSEPTAPTKSEPESLPTEDIAIPEPVPKPEPEPEAESWSEAKAEADPPAQPKAEKVEKFGFGFFKNRFPKW